MNATHDVLPSFKAEGDGTPATITTHFNDGTGPDPYLSPGGTFLFTTTDMQTHIYTMAGSYALTLMVADDDIGGRFNIARHGWGMAWRGKRVLERKFAGTRHSHPSVRAWGSGALRVGEEDG